MPTDEAEYVVIGLTNGPGFHANPCLADQVAWAKQRGLLVAAYSVISWPDEAPSEQYGGLREAGYAQAEFNVASMKAAGLDSPIVWLDVEQVPFYEWCAEHRRQRRGRGRCRAGLPRRRATGSASTPRRTSGSRSSATCRSACPSGGRPARPRRPRR